MKKENQTSPEELCKEFICSFKKATLTTYQNVTLSGSSCLVGFSAIKEGLPRATITISLTEQHQHYKNLEVNKQFLLALSQGTDHRVFTFKDVTLESFNPSLSTDGKTALIAICLSNLRFIDVKNNINAEVKL